MHLVFEFPLIDLRKLYEDEGGKLPRPSWGLFGENTKDFVRRWGKILPRKGEGVDNFPGENFFCDISNALRFTDLQKQGFSGAITHSAIHKCYRRFYFEQPYAGRAEIGFAENTENKLSEAGEEAEAISLYKIIEHYASLPAAMGDNKIPLYKAGKYLAASYHTNTSDKNAANTALQDSIIAGEMLLILSFAQNEKIKLPNYSSLILELPLSSREEKINLFVNKVTIDGLRFKTWIIQTPCKYQALKGEDRDSYRMLRLNLMKLHQEKETIRVLLQFLNTRKCWPEPNTEEADTLLDFLNETGKRIFKKKRYGLSQENLRDYALQSEEKVDAGELLSLEKATKSASSKYLRKNFAAAAKIMTPKIVLLLSASPADTQNVQMDKEYRDIKIAERLGLETQNFDLILELAVLKESVQKLLETHQPDYLHLSMHNSMELGLCFEDENRQVAPLAVEEFKEIIKKYTKEKPLKLILLSACNSKAHAEQVLPYCEYAVGTNKVFPVLAGLAYSLEFYKVLFNTKNAELKDCHDKGIEAIAKLGMKPVGKVPIEKIMELLHSQ